MLPLTELVRLTLSIGICEETTTTYTLRAIAPDAALVAYDVEAEWCEEDPDTGEKRGTIKSILVADFDTRGKAHYFTPEPGSEHKPSGTVRPAKDWPAFEKEKGFKPIGALGSFLQGPCTGAVVAVGKAPKPLPEPAEAPMLKSFGLGVAVTTPAGALPPVRIGAHVQSQGQPQVVLVPLPAKGAVRVFTVTAKCAEGGPPPGYFGEDDPGTCLVEWVRRKVDLTVAKVPGLAACLPAP